MSDWEEDVDPWIVKGVARPFENDQPSNDECLAAGALWGSLGAGLTRAGPAAPATLAEQQPGLAKFGCGGAGGNRGVDR